MREGSAGSEPSPWFAWEDLEWAILPDAEGDEGELVFRRFPRPVGPVVEVIVE
ncbi:MAG: hypothetical protein M5U13_11505 [Thermoanaerobaculia bacterium]|nr:hypothetical protein [Thermoanaerobaculia bacterium]